MGKLSELTKRTRKFLGGELFQFSWELRGPHAADRPVSPDEETPDDKPRPYHRDLGFGLR